MALLAQMHAIQEIVLGDQELIGQRHQREGCRLVLDQSSKNLFVILGITAPF